VRIWNTVPEFLFANGTPIRKLFPCVCPVHDLSQAHVASALLSLTVKSAGGVVYMDALELLKQDHQKVKGLFKEAEEADEKKQKQVFEQIKTELETHTHIEESVFYPAMQKHEELKDMVLESLEEHKQVKTLLREMDNLSSDSQKFEPKLKVLMENVEHHAEEEEEEKMFPKVRKLVNKAELEQLGQELEAAKRQKR
jgi:hemerythrin superfamily protein